MARLTVKCDECASLVELKREKDHTLSLVCNCGSSRSIKVIRKLPTGWEP